VAVDAAGSIVLTEDAAGYGADTCSGAAEDSAHTGTTGTGCDRTDQRLRLTFIQINLQA
jgi:hypothetical protein